jgi:hypothetical protein
VLCSSAYSTVKWRQCVPPPNHRLSSNELHGVVSLKTHRTVEVEVNLRPTVSRSVCLGVRRPSGTSDQFFFLLEISFRQLRVCYFVAPSLTRGQVCNLLIQLLLGLARAVTLGSKSLRTHGHILLSHLRLPQPGGPGPNIYLPQELGGPVIPPGTGFRGLVQNHRKSNMDHNTFRHLNCSTRLQQMAMYVQFPMRSFQTRVLSPAIYHH